MFIVISYTALFDKGLMFFIAFVLDEADFLYMNTVTRFITVKTNAYYFLTDNTIVFI